MIELKKKFSINSENLSKIGSLQVVMIDNYDSFTYNLVQYLREIGVKNLRVIRNDEMTSSEVIKLAPNFIVISPGPSSPNEAGISVKLIQDAHKNSIPLFGVCLGMQSMAQAFGADIIKADLPVHGKTSPISHDGRYIFKDIEQNISVTRYHSLIINKSTLPDCFEISAKTQDDIIMAIRHKSSPLESVQYHPESVLTDFGHKQLLNFIETQVL